ncbi:antibiotic biosynthesis monooxygenase family protein [Streptacidiphilus monticola]
MDRLVRQQPGFLGMDSARDGDGFGITVGYFRDEESIRQWLVQPDHAGARDRGRAEWYHHYSVHVAKVERAYRWDRP